MPAEILFAVENHIATLQVNRPQARNALNWRAQEAFAALVNRVAREPAIRVLVITGSGDQAFVSGADLKELSRHPEAEAAERLHQVMSAALEQLTQLPIPVIAAVNGDAFGGGCEILTACDIRLALPEVRFCFAQIKNGLTTGWGGTARLVSLIGQSRAMELLLTARQFSAQEAAAIGFLHHIVTETDLAAAVSTLAKQLVELPRQAIAATKRLTRSTQRHSTAALSALERELFVELWPQADHLEAVAAFLEKRPPRFE